MNGLPCLVRHDKETGKEIHILIDSGASNNYIKKNCKIGSSIHLVKPILSKTLHGYAVIKSKKLINVLNNDLCFYEIDELREFDMILGEQGLRKIKAQINFFEYKIYYQECYNEQKINYTNDDPNFENQISELMQNNETISNTLPFTTTIEATIRTKSDEPIWSKQYPYPALDSDFVNQELKRLLENEIIKKSRSPYNSPIWTAPKRGEDENGKPKRRLVIDFQKLNDQTIRDRYPIRDVNLTLQSLGKAKIFSVIDLESGFHQILIKKTNREKTSFSVNGAKYEFIRMPFGLKNAPSVFQRCVDDILREYIGKFAYVYVDDIIIFSNSPEEHIDHIRTIINSLHTANMKISSTKSHFFKKSVEYLGHIIQHGKITVDPEKIKTIKNYPVPKTLWDLRSFLGLAGYYRRFIKNYAHIAKPLTIHLSGENGRVTKNRSHKVSIKFDAAALKAFERIKTLLQEKIELFQPDFSKPFELTTDASNFAIGAVLSQNQHPVTFYSRSLNKTEQNYATNEKELLAIVWALQKLRNYLYGVADLTILSDHQSLQFSISERNPNSKLKRWKNFIAKYGAKIIYKPGSQNVVADALSRQVINLSSLSSSEHSQESSPIPDSSRTHFPLNRFKNQIELIETKNLDEINSQTIFENFYRHTIKFSTLKTLKNSLKNAFSQKHLNAIFAQLELQNEIKKLLLADFPLVKFVFTENKREDIVDKDSQINLVQSVHNRAHRNYTNNLLELNKDYFWPTMHQDCKQFALQCKTCLTEKYERRPLKEKINPTPIPSKPGESIQMDLFHLGGNLFISTIDRYSKYCYMREIPN